MGTIVQGHVLPTVGMSVYTQMARASVKMAGQVLFVRMVCLYISYIINENKLLLVDLEM